MKTLCEKILEKGEHYFLIDPWQAVSVSSPTVVAEAAKVWEASYLRVHNAHRARKCFFGKKSLLSQGI